MIWYSLYIRHISCENRSFYLQETDKDELETFIKSRTSNGDKTCPVVWMMMENFKTEVSPVRTI
jgi:hypothetical protein